MAARVVVPALGVVITGHFLRKLLAKWTSSRYGDLESLISYSSRLVAAARAVESQRPDAFVVDPLAHILAGPQALARYQERAQREVATAQTDNSTSSGGSIHQTQLDVVEQQSNYKQEQQSGNSNGQVTDHATSELEQQAHNNVAADKQQQQRRLVPRIIMRTVFFDDAVLAAVGNLINRSSAAMSAVLQCKEQHRLPPCRQVVLLGSGMDTRPWRLDLPPGIAWFEVDRHDVLRTKKAELRKHNVTFRCSSSNNNSAASGQSPASSANRATAAVHQSQNTAGKKTEIQLQAASWGCAAVDLQVSGWSKKLIKAGLDQRQPTVWVAEGLSYYLRPECVAPMLQEVASISAPGSILALNFITESRLKNLQEIRAARAAAAAQATEARDCKGSNGQQSGVSSRENSRCDSSIRGRVTSELKWGCPDDCKKYFADQGWDMLVQLPWTKAAAAYGWQPQLLAEAVGRPPSFEVQFAMLVRM